MNSSPSEKRPFSPVKFLKCLTRFFIDHSCQNLLRAIPFETPRGDGLEKISDAHHTFYFFRGRPPYILFFSQTPQPYFCNSPPPYFIDIPQEHFYMYIYRKNTNITSEKLNPPPSVIFFTTTPRSYFFCSRPPPPKFFFS